LGEKRRMVRRKQNLRKYKILTDKEELIIFTEGQLGYIWGYNYGA
jgi:hypothetical protein